MLLSAAPGLLNPGNIRYVWEIVLGAHSYFEKEESLVTLDIEDGATVDVIGDVHGRFLETLGYCVCDRLIYQVNSTITSIYCPSLASQTRSTVCL